MSSLPPRVLQTLQRQPGMRQALLFGSLAAGRARPDSDMDIAVDLGRPLDSVDKARLIEALAEASGRAIDLIDLRTAGEPLLGQILKHGQRLIGSDADYAELMRRHIFDSEDFLPYVERMLRERRQAWIG